MSTVRTPQQSKAGRATRIWVAISGHGHGHLVQVTPLIKALRARTPAPVLAIQSELPADLLQRTIGDPPEIHKALHTEFHTDPGDIGMVMDGPMQVLPEESLAAYRQLHADWDQRVARQLALYDAFKPDLVISDIPYLPLAAADSLRIPSVAVCSLNWADLLEHYCAHLDGADALVDVIRSIYAAADLFLRPAPAMPMPTLGNTAAIGPLFTAGNNRRRELDAKLALPPETRLVLVTLGGITGQIDVAAWPAIDNTVFLIPDAWRADSSQFHSIESVGMSYADLFSSCDALITKPGYGAFTGAGCTALPVLYCERGDWPEEPFLTDWLTRHGRASAIDWPTLVSGHVSDALDTLLRQPRKQPVRATGAAEGIAMIDQLLHSRGL